MEILFVLFCCVILFKILSWLGSQFQEKEQELLNKKYYKAELEKIKSSLVKGNSQSYSWSILEADKLVDRAMIELGFFGDNFGMRLKNNRKFFSRLNSLWDAHKLRNKIAHEHGFELTYYQARQALSDFEQALKDLHAI
jgi:hypothetical protein